MLCTASLYTYRCVESLSYSSYSANFYLTNYAIGVLDINSKLNQNLGDALGNAWYFKRMQRYKEMIDNGYGFQF